MSQCVYLGEKTGGNVIDDGRKIHICHINQHCTTSGPANPYASCEHCSKKIMPGDAQLSTNFKDHLAVYNRHLERTDALRDYLKGCPVGFLVCGGPSAKKLDLSLLEQRGVFSLAVNNMAGYYKADAFVCSDPPRKFHNGIWQDPKTMKLIPTPKLRVGRGKLRRKTGETFEALEINGEVLSSCHMPNVWGFERRSWFQPDDTFFTETSAAWGNHDAGVKRTGQPKTVNTMFLAMRMLYYLGARTIYLVGVDFNMNPQADIRENYAFGENRDENAIASNNNQYNVANRWLCEMQKKGVFARFGVNFYNCNQNSHLGAFPYVPFETAVSHALENYPEEPFDLNRWYEK